MKTDPPEQRIRVRMIVGPSQLPDYLQPLMRHAQTVRFQSSGELVFTFNDALC